MKSTLAAMFQMLWRSTAILRRPLIRRFDRRVLALMASRNVQAMEAVIEALDQSSRRLERLDDRIIRVDQAAQRMVEEVDLVLNGLTREIFRLQAEVESLKQQVDSRDAIDLTAGEPVRELDLISGGSRA